MARATDSEPRSERRTEEVSSVFTMVPPGFEGAPKVELQRWSSEAISSRLTAWTEREGLVIEGQDTGPRVKQMWGDSDYEYWLRVDRRYLDQLSDHLFALLDNDPERIDTKSSSDERLLEMLRLAWTDGVFASDVEFRRWLESVPIPSRFDSYA